MRMDEADRGARIRPRSTGALRGAETINPHVMCGVCTAGSQRGHSALLLGVMTQIHTREHILMPYGRLFHPSDGHNPVKTRLLKLDRPRSD